MLRFAPVVLASALLLNAQAPVAGSFDLHVTTTRDAPVAGATVSIEGPDGQVHSGATAADGHFRAANLTPGTYRFVAFDAPGYARDGRNFLADVSVHAGHTRAYSFQLVPAPKIEGTVTGEDGNPIEGATVIVEFPHGDSRNFSGKTNAQGAFTLILTALPESFLGLSLGALPPLTMTSSALGQGVRQEGPTYYSGTARIVLRPGYTPPFGLSFRVDGAPVPRPQ